MLRKYSKYLDEVRIPVEASVVDSPLFSLATISLMVGRSLATIRSINSSSVNSSTLSLLMEPFSTESSDLLKKNILM